MKKLFGSGIVITLVLSACNNDSGKLTSNSDSSIKLSPVINNLSEQDKADGWQLLFDGQSTKGWHKYGNEPVGSAWKIEDGTIWLDTASKQNGKIAGGGDILTDEEYENFHLKLEWKISAAGNSGIMFNVNEDTVKYKRPYETGPEMQIVDNDGHPDGKIVKHQAGDLYDLIACNKKTVKPAGEWNKVEIKLLNGKLDLFLNGENVVSTTMWDDNWNKLVAGSKFTQWPGFGTFRKGKICLQDHDNMVWFRDIKIKKL
jgi:hypothetical protein